MNRTEIIIGKFVLAVLFAAVISADIAAGQAITRVKLDKKLFNPALEKKLSLSFELSQIADVNVIIYDRTAFEVRRFELPQIGPGRCSLDWDGLDNKNSAVGGDVFLYVIEAKTKDGGCEVYNPAENTGGFEVKALEYKLDTEQGRIEYVLPKACMVRIRAGLRSGIFAGSVLDWQGQPAGRHTINWDGRDTSGLINLLNNPELDLRLSCYSLPSNSIIIKGENKQTALPKKLSASQRKKRDELWGTEGKYLHYRHEPKICRDPQFEIILPNSRKTPDGDTPMISGVTPVRIVLDESCAEHLINSRFEVMVFVDGVFLYEIEEGSNPFTYQWDTRAFSKGPCVLTVNIIGYEDHIGSRSIRLLVGD